MSAFGVGGDFGRGKEADGACFDIALIVDGDSGVAVCAFGRALDPGIDADIAGGGDLAGIVNVDGDRAVVAIGTPFGSGIDAGEGGEVARIVDGDAGVAVGAVGVPRSVRLNASQIRGDIARIVDDDAGVAGSTGGVARGRGVNPQGAARDDVAGIVDRDSVVFRAGGASDDTVSARVDIAAIFDGDEAAGAIGDGSDTVVRSGQVAAIVKGDEVIVAVRCEANGIGRIAIANAVVAVDTNDGCCRDLQDRRRSGRGAAATRCRLRNRGRWCEQRADQKGRSKCRAHQKRGPVGPLESHEEGRAQRRCDRTGRQPSSPTRFYLAGSSPALAHLPIAPRPKRFTRYRPAYPRARPG